MALFSRKPASVTPEVVPAEPAPPVVGKGAPTPKRRDRTPHRGPLAPPPQTQREAYRRAKTSTTPMTKEERKVAVCARRERMMRGDDSAVLARDRGPVRRYVRDLVDSRRNLSSLLLPVLLVVFLLSLIGPTFQVYGFLVMLVVVLASVLDAYFAGRQFRQASA